MTNIAKLGLFSDGGQRIRVVTSGSNADPIPTDQRNIIFDSDWGEALITAPGYFGTMSLPSSVGAPTTVSVSFAASLGYIPFTFYALPGVALLPNVSGNIITPYMATLLANTYGASPALQLGAINGTPASATVTSSGFSFAYEGVSATGLWMAWTNDPTVVAGSTASRAGTGTWMELTANGPVVARPGYNVSATDFRDFLIPPISSGAVVNQPRLAGTITSLPWLSNSTISGTVYGNYGVTIAHGLGYIPMFFATSYYDFRVAALQDEPIVAVDTNNLYIVYSLGP